MLSLCIDTAYKYLTVCLLDDNKVIKSISKECFKRQSEELFVCLDELFSDLDRQSIEAICISAGPGSYTGVRIAMSLAKVYCEVANIDLYIISTLRLYAGNNENTMVVMDARANRAYVGVYDKDVCLFSDKAMELALIDTKDYRVVLDGELVGCCHNDPDIVQCFINTRNMWQRVENINFLEPIYLKESSDYYR